MTWHRRIAWTTVAGAVISAAAWCGYECAQRPLWVGEQREVDHFAFTLDDGELVEFIRISEDQNEEWAFTAIRHDARSGRVIGTSLIKLDHLEDVGRTPCLLRDNLLWFEHWAYRVPTSLYDLRTGQRVAGPIPASHLTYHAVDPNGRWFADLTPNRVRVRIVSFVDGQTVWEAERHWCYAKDALAFNNGRCVLIKWISENDRSQTIESREIASGRKLAEASIKPRPYSEPGFVIADRAYYACDGSMYSFDLSDANFGCERSEPIRHRQSPFPAGRRNLPEALVAVLYPTQVRWHQLFNQLLSGIGLKTIFPTGGLTNAVIDSRTGELVFERPFRGHELTLSPCTGLVATYDIALRQLVVWDVRRSPMRWALASALIAAIGVLLVANWRARR